MFKYNSFSTCATGSTKGAAQRKFSKIKTILAVAATVTAIQLSVTPARAAGALWISAWNWCYSSAAAASPAGSIYFWSLQTGANSWSWAGAYSVSPGLGSAYAFAMSGARQGGVGAVQVAGIADPFAADSINYPLVDPTNPSSWPASDPTSDPFSSSYSLSLSGATINESDMELSGDDEIEAFAYTGNIDNASLEADFGATSDGGSTSTGDVDSLSALEADFGSSLVALDAPDDDPGNTSFLNFTENTSAIDGGMDNVILVGVEDAQVVPEPSPTWLLGVGVAGLLIFRKLRSAKVA